MLWTGIKIQMHYTKEIIMGENQELSFYFLLVVGVIYEKGELTKGENQVT